MKDIFTCVKRDFNLTTDENPLLLISLLLASPQRPSFNENLLTLGHRLFYQVDYVPKTERLPNGISDYLLELKSRCKDRITCAYLDSLAGIKYQYNKDNLLDWRRSIINSRLLRVFYNSDDLLNYPTPRKNLLTFMCIVGLKGSGKSTLINQLNNENMQVIEVYKELYERKLETKLPHPKYWSDEPLKMVLNAISLKSDVVFVGSMLRQEEFYFLNQLGNVRIVEIKTKNPIRYQRLLERGRKIETNISKLIGLDLNRFGFKVGYETNDLGFWLTKSEITIDNNIDDLNLREIINTKLMLGNC